MGNIKIGPAEEKLISQIGEFKEIYVDRLCDIIFGIELAMNHIPEYDGKEENILLYNTKVRKEMKHLKEVVEWLKTIIDSIYFRDKQDEEKFDVSWVEYDDSKVQAYRYGYGKSSKGSQITEKQFVVAIISWEKEVLKRIGFLNKSEEITYREFTSKMEKSLQKIIKEYVES